MLFQSPLEVTSTNLSFNHSINQSINPYNHPTIGHLISKPYFPGAHAYRLNKQGADLLINGIKNAKPTDVYLNKHWFPWLEEYNPWPVLCKDNFTTIQKEEGCLAKHNWSDEYEII